MACSNSAEWIASGESQLDAAQLSGPARTQATLSLRLSNPFQPQTSQLYSGPINRNQPYFLPGDGGCPQLVIPAAGNSPDIPQSSPATLSNPALPPSPSPVTITDTFTGAAMPTLETPLTPEVPPSQPCPPGFVSSGAPELTNEQLTSEVARQLAGGLPSGGSGGGGCTPQIVLAPQQMVAKNDFVVVSASSIFNQFGTSTSVLPLTVWVRLMTCDGRFQSMQSSLDLTHIYEGGAVQGRICIPLTDGYLLSVVASGAPFCTQPGEVWVQGEVRNAGCDGTPALPLFAGYLVDQGYIGWPGGPQVPWAQSPPAKHGVDAIPFPGANPSFVPEDGVRVRIRQVYLDFQTNATVAARVPILTWFPPDNGATVTISTQVSQPAGKLYRWTWANNLEPGLMLGGVHAGGSLALDGVVQIPIPDDLFGTHDSELAIEIANRVAGVGGDTIIDSAVEYDVWAEPADIGF